MKSKLVRLPGERKANEAAMLPCKKCEEWTRHEFHKRDPGLTEVKVLYRCTVCKTIDIWGLESPAAAPMEPQKPRKAKK